MKSSYSIACEKQPATGSRGMAVTNHPMASAAAAEILLGGGNAIDATVAALFALTVVEPMMVGVLGGGLCHLRLADGRHLVIDGLSTAPQAATPDMYTPVGQDIASYRATADRRNLLGPLSVAVPAALAGWLHALKNYGTLGIDDVIQPAIRLAERGFVVSPYLATNISNCQSDLASDKGLAHRFLPGGAPLRAGTRLVQGDYGTSLRLIAAHGLAALNDGPLGEALTALMKAAGGIITMADLAATRVIERQPVTGSYRGFAIVGPPPPASSGVHIVQMLNLLESRDIGAIGFGTADGVHLLAEVMKIAFADRAVATADPDFVDVPVRHLISKDYAGERQPAIRMDRAGSHGPGLAGGESANTTHVTVADAFGNVVASTQTINGLFGACLEVPGTGMIANNYMFNFDPHPGQALSIAPGKRVFTSMAPMMVLKGGKLAFALGLPGGLRIFPSAFQAIVNLLDHGMSPQEAVEAPRVWTEGGVLEIEPAIAESVVAALRQRGHEVVRVPRVAGGMNMIAFAAGGEVTGAACWRADGVPVAIAGGNARAGVGFSIS
jgi:gamma-glutamyltranspeptidase / glutathione hydrolase